MLKSVKPSDLNRQAHELLADDRNQPKRFLFSVNCLAGKLSVFAKAIAVFSPGVVMVRYWSFHKTSVRLAESIDLF